MFRANNSGSAWTQLQRASLFLLFLFSSVQCSMLGGAPGGGTGNLTGSTASGADSSTADSDDLSGETAMRPASIPAPTSKKKIIAFSPDSQSQVPVVGFDEAVATSGTDAGTGEAYEMSDADGDGYVEGYNIVASAGKLEASDFCDGYVAGAVDYSGTDDAGNPYTCCSITTSGSFECYLNNASSSTTAHIYVTDGSNLGEETSEAVNTALLWTRSEPKDVKTGPSTSGTNLLFSLTESAGVAISELGGTFTVQGKADTHYQAFNNSDQRQLAYDAMNGEISGLMSTDGISVSSFDTSLADLSGLTDAIAYERTVTVSGTEIYNHLKTATNGGSYFIRKPTIPIDTMESLYIYSTSEETNLEYYTQKDAHSYAAVSTGLDSISNTIAFDIQSDNMMLTLVESEGEIYLLNTLVNMPKSEYVVGDDAPLDIPYSYDENGLCHLRDIQIYQENSRLQVSGRALLLDQANDRIGIISYDIFSASLPAVEGWVNLGDGKSPVAMTLNTDKSRAYILNGGDNTVSVLKLKEGGTTRRAPRIESTVIDLSSYLAEESLTLTPTAITHHVTSSGTEYLVVSERGLKGSIIVEL